MYKVARLPASEARSRFSEVLDDALRGIHTVIMRRERPAAILIRYDIYQDLLRKAGCAGDDATQSEAGGGGMPPTLNGTGGLE